MQSVEIDGSWTTRLPAEPLATWAARAPAGDDAPSDCDHETSWNSGGSSFSLCTKCLGDETPAGCKTRHEEAVEFWQQANPPS